MTCSILMDFATRRILRASGPVQAIVAPPGSTLKPFVLSALLDAGKIRANEKIPCPIELVIKGRSFSCSHPAMASPMTVATAIAYSCNTFIARVAERFAPGELARYLAHAGLAASRVRGITDQRLQALGVEHVSAALSDLEFGYHTLATRSNPAILEGLEGAVEYGTAQGAQLERMKVAGKTGSAPGNAAWFAGFAPSRGPRAILVVLTGGKSGGADAAPLSRDLW